MPTLRNIRSNAGKQNKAILAGTQLADIPSDHALRLIGTTDYLTLVNTNRVSVWDDITSRYTFTQGSNSDRPFYDATHQSPNGKNSVYFDGKLVKEGAQAGRDYIDSTNGQTIIVAGGQWTNNSDNVFAKWDPNANNRCYRMETDSYTVQSNGNTDDSTQRADFTRPTGDFILMGRWNPGVECAAYLNGSTSPLASASSPASSDHNANEPVKIGSDSDESSRLNTGEIFEIIIYKRAITDAEWAIIYSNLKRFWLL